MTTAPGRTLSPHGSVRLDAVIVATLLLADATSIIVDVSRHSVGAGQVVALGIVAAAVAISFWWRRDQPLRVLAVVFVGWIAAAAAQNPSPLVTQRTGVQVVLVVYAVASWSERRRLAALIPAALAVLVVVGTATSGKGAAATASIPVALFAAPWFAGYAGRMRRQHLDDIEQRLRRVEADAGQQARLAVAEERARIARELHDVVAHHISLIGLQAGAARTTLDRDADGTRTALAGIERSSRDAVHEMRHLLDALGSPDAPDLAPAPGLNEFGLLCDTYRAAGLDVRRVSTHTLERLPPLHALTLYRIAEEALTNVTRHSAASTCTLELCIDAAEARISVSDPGPSRPLRQLPEPGHGRGLIGMRQRVDLFGGTLVARPGDRGGFLVDASIPLEPR